jgi:hypothetical protein
VITNKYGFPKAVVSAMEHVDDAYDMDNSEGNKISVTTLIDAPYIAYLRRKYPEIKGDAADKLLAFRGSLVHSIMENIALPNVIKEVRLEVPFKIGNKDVVLSGKNDILYVEEGILQDYKVQKANSWTYIKYKGYKEEWKYQLNILRWLWQQWGMNIIEKLEQVLIFPELTEFEMMQHDMPDKPVIVSEVPVMPDWEVEKYISERLALHLVEEPEPCSPAERWARPSKWALMKEGRKTAVKLYDSKLDADTALKACGKGHYLEYRQGDSTRCKSCAFKSVCKLWTAEGRLTGSRLAI